MGKIRLKKLLCTGLLGGSMLMGGMVEAGVITDRLPLTCYADHKVITYNSLGAKSAGYISANVDLIQITQVRGDGWCYGSYPGAGGRRVSRWFKITDVCADTGYTNRSANVKGRQNVYRTRSGGATIGSVSNNEGVIVVADNGSRAQIVYRLDNGTGYKLGWVPSAAVPPPVPTKRATGDMNGDGVIDKKDLDIMRECMFNESWTPQQLAAGDFSGNGKITLEDFSTLKQRIQEQPIVNPVSKKLEQLANSVNGYRIGTKYTGSGQCRGFANKVYLATFQGVQYISGYANSNFGAASFAGSHEVGRLFNFSTGATAEVKALFMKARPGAFVQMGRRYTLNSNKTAPSPHSAIIYSISDNCVQFYEANTDGKNTIKVNFYNWSDLANKNKGFTIYEPNNYALK